MCFNTSPPTQATTCKVCQMQTQTPSFVAGAYDEETSSEAQEKHAWKESSEYVDQWIQIGGTSLWLL